MTSEQKILKAIKHCEDALENLKNNNKRLTVGSLDHVQEKITAAKWLLIDEIKQEEGGF